MSLPTMSAEDTKKLAHFLGEGIKVKQEVSDLTEGLNEVKKHLADELDIPVRDLGKALTIAFKKREDSEAFDSEQESLDTVGEILETTGF